MKKNICLAFAVIMAFLSAIFTLSARVYIIPNIQRVIQSYEKAITTITDQANLSEIKKNQVKILAKEQEIKRKIGLANLEEQKAYLERNRDLVAALVYENAIAEKTNENLFAEINKIIYQIYDDSEVKSDLNKILELKRKITERMSKFVDRIQKLGGEIELQLTKAQIIQQLNSAQSALVTVEQNIKTKELSPEAVKLLSPFRRELTKLDGQVKKSISRLPTTARDQIERLNNAINRLEIILNYLRDPVKIQSTSESEILGIK